ncbi:MAG TPA: phosphodiesterase [Candidatus Gallacutalibacter pullicola]|uniref:Phosphoesterase n=1 Tax=Candidatus Gallacutalibacter pullicola TaxID=2840830 RepID=A0A9D1DP29_9FIRM|nr:phosphodiesterase [Candidatus Gallacutalibacter pullicola]
MKLMIASDIHGSAGSCRKMLDQFEKEGAQRLLLLGDLLYHGPRNDLPGDYRPKEVISLLNGKKQSLLCVRGNCEAEVDQMVLEFPVLSDSMILFLDGRMVFATHGHIFHEDHLPPLQEGDILLHGHTHVPVLENRGSYILLNPGSVSLPKQNTAKSYMIYENGVFTLKDLDGNKLNSLSVS